jgi:hypothetical protein
MRESEEKRGEKRRGEEETALICFILKRKRSITISGCQGGQYPLIHELEDNEWATQSLNTSLQK